jgi:uncharacterized protein with von Willebrand factor type A (vWA) domain
MIKKTQSVDDKLPLLDLFTRLREAGLPLGIGEYQLLLRALEGGFGVSDRADLKRLCQTLWINSSEEQCLLDYHFDQVMPELEEQNFINQSPQTQLSIYKHNKKTKIKKHLNTLLI